MGDDMDFDKDVGEYLAGFSLVLLSFPLIIKGIQYGSILAGTILITGGIYELFKRCLCADSGEVIPWLVPINLFDYY